MPLVRGPIGGCVGRRRDQNRSDVSARARRPAAAFPFWPRRGGSASNVDTTLRVRTSGRLFMHDARDDAPGIQDPQFGDTALIDETLGGAEQGLIEQTAQFGVRLINRNAQCGVRLWAGQKGGDILAAIARGCHFECACELVPQRRFDSRAPRPLETFSPQCLVSRTVAVASKRADAAVRAALLRTVAKRMSSTVR